jgi:hypothetical protein
VKERSQPLGTEAKQNFMSRGDKISAKIKWMTRKHRQKGHSNPNEIYKKRER